MLRIKKLCSYLKACNTFADVACDHGYCAQYMLKNNLSGSAVVSDISDKCLEKAKALLKQYIDSGRCSAVCCDGLAGISPDTDCVLIAGIGGEEIIKILKEGFIPKSFVFQPMKNADILRQYLLNSGCALFVDDIFSDGKNYYFIISGQAGEEQAYTPEQIEYGRDSLKNPIFYNYLKEEIQKKISYLSRPMSADSRQKLESSIAKMQEVYKSGTEKDI